MRKGLQRKSFLALVFGQKNCSGKPDPGCLLRSITEVFTGVTPKIFYQKNLCVTPFLPVSAVKNYQPNIYAKINGTTMVASLSTMNLGVWISSLPQVIFSLGTAPL
jgi:hypothetical protein